MQRDQHLRRLDEFVDRAFDEMASDDDDFPHIPLSEMRPASSWQQKLDQQRRGDTDPVHFLEIALQANDRGDMDTVKKMLQSARNALSALSRVALTHRQERKSLLISSPVKFILKSLNSLEEDGHISKTTIEKCIELTKWALDPSVE